MIGTLSYVDGDKFWAFGHINSVVEAGFMEGTGRTTFSPTGSTTRAQAIKAILSFSDLAPRVGQITDAEADAILTRFSMRKRCLAGQRDISPSPYARNW